MKEKKDLILDASIKVFSEKGYTLATTLEISKKAGVSEMTIFRHFQTKKNLFLSAIQKVIGDALTIDEQLDFNYALKEFIFLLLDEKLTMISKHKLLIRMLIRENLAHTVPEELAFTKMIYNQVIQKVSNYIKYHQLAIDPISFAEMIVGLLLRYAIMEDSNQYHLMDSNEQKIYITNYLNILNI